MYGAIKEARREDLDLQQGVWKRELKVGDFPQVISLTTTALKERTKDLQIAAWLTEALIRQEGFAGLSAGLQLLHGLLSKFWDTVYPQIEEDNDLELRVTPLSWLSQILVGDYGKFDAVRNSPLTRDGYGLIQYKEGHRTWYGPFGIRGPKDNRDMAITEGFLMPEVFNQSVAGTPEAFYVELEANLNASLASLDALSSFCDAKFGDDSPEFGRLQTALNDVRQTTRRLLANKRNAES